MQIKFSIIILVAIVALIAFTIGLNLGMHDTLSFIHMSSSATADVMTSSSAQPPEISPTESMQRKSTYPVALHEVPASLPKSVEYITTQPPQLVENTAKKLTIENKIAKIEEKISEVASNLRNDKDTEVGAISSFIKEGGKLPIVLLTSNRFEMLGRTLESLLSVRGVSKDQILISQDGTMVEISSVAKKFGIPLVQNRGQTTRDGAQRIARHYGFSLTHAFDRNVDAPAIIIVEDDLLFSPDFYDYFCAVAPILDRDPTTFIISAWSDNGFKDKVRDVHALLRTDYFPGLGWLLSRRLYKGELEKKWPSEHWDHWLRDPVNSKNREIVFPQVPRSYHNGIKGTFMNLETHNRYFRDIGYNQNPEVTWELSTSSAPKMPYYLPAVEEYYESRIRGFISSCHHATSVEDFVSLEDEIICIWIDVEHVSPYNPPKFGPISAFFGIWHEHRRGSHKGVHEFYGINNNYFLLINIYSSRGKRNTFDDHLSYQHLMPDNIRPLSPKSFDKRILFDVQRKSLHIEGVKASDKGMSCDSVCAAYGQKCNPDHLKLLNSCEEMKRHFPCSTCKNSIGHEQPAYVDPTADLVHGPGDCLVNTLPEQSLCAASHQHTVRLCACS